MSNTALDLVSGSIGGIAGTIVGKLSRTRKAKLNLHYTYIILYELVTDNLERSPL